MATLTAEQKVSQGLIDELEVIAAQNEAGRGQSSEDRAIKRSLIAMGEKLDSLSERLTGEGVEEATLSSIVAQLTSWGDLILPTAEVTWDRETATSKVQALTAFGALGYLTEEQAEQLDSIKSRLAIKRSGTGERAERTAQEAIEGRPLFVTITDEDGQQFSKQRGNTATTVANLKTRVGLYIKAKTGEVMPDEVGKMVLAAAKEVVEDGKPQASVGGFTFQAVTA